MMMMQPIPLSVVVPVAIISYNGSYDMIRPIIASTRSSPNHKIQGLEQFNLSTSLQTIQFLDHI